jgi:hypothetical protein
VWPCEEEAFYGVARGPADKGLVSDSGEGCCWCEDDRDVAEDTAVCVWDAMDATELSLPCCGLWPVDEDESGGEGNRDAPPLEDTVSCSCAGKLSVSAVTVRFDEAVLGIVEALYFGDVEGRVEREGATSLGRLLDSDRYEDS